MFRSVGVRCCVDGGGIAAGKPANIESLRCRSRRWKIARCCPLTSPTPLTTASPVNGPGDYSTLLGSGGPQHVVDANVFMGGNIDAETDAFPNAAANGDDVDQALPDDEDGLVDPSTDLQLTVGAQPHIRVTVTNTSGSDATLSGWIDYNGNGVFDNAAERAQANVPAGTSSAVVSLTFPAVPQGAVDSTYARFRLSTDVAAENPTGSATDGEVDDYAASITNPGVATAIDFTKIAHETNGGPDDHRDSNAIRRIGCFNRRFEQRRRERPGGRRVSRQYRRTVSGCRVSALHERRQHSGLDRENRRRHS